MHEPYEIFKGVGLELAPDRGGDGGELRITVTGTSTVTIKRVLMSIDAREQGNTMPLGVTLGLRPSSDSETVGDDGDGRAEEESSRSRSSSLSFRRRPKCFFFGGLDEASITRRKKGREGALGQKEEDWEVEA